jgi:hypothetical protein
MSRRVSVLLARHTFKPKRFLQEKTIEAPVVAIKTTHGLIITLARHKKGEREMGSQARGDDSESVIPFTPAARSTAPDGIDQVDKAGQTILGLLHKAAGGVRWGWCLSLGLKSRFSPRRLNHLFYVLQR